MNSKIKERVQQEKEEEREQERIFFLICGEFYNNSKSYLFIAQHFIWQIIHFIQLVSNEIFNNHTIKLLKSCFN